MHSLSGAIRLVSVASSSAARIRALIATAALLAAGTVAAADLPRILYDAAVAKANPLPDFSYAGYGFGTSALPTARGAAIDVTAYGAVADDALDDSAAILSALKAAHEIEGPVTLRFPSGRFIISDVLLIERSHMQIEGAGRGEGGTELYFPRPLRMVDKSDRLDELRSYLKQEDKRQIEPLNNIDEPFSAWSWSGGFIWTKAPRSRPVPYLGELSDAEPALPVVSSGKANQRQLTVQDSGQYQPGDVIRIEWYPRDGEQSGLLDSLFGKDFPAIGQRMWENPERAIVVQTTQIESVSRGALRIADPLLHDIGPRIPARLRQWTGLREVGVRDLALTFPPGRSFGHHLEEGYNGIDMTDVFNGWVESVHIRNADSAVLTNNSASLTIRDVVTDGSRKAHYSVHIGNVHNVLVSDLDVRNATVHTLSFNTQATRSVFQRATLWNSPVLDQHAGANHQNLFDNLTIHISPTRLDGVPTYALWDGSGAAYWQPGHGRYNAHWNFRVLVTSGARADETVRLNALDEGPDARLVGVFGNRQFSVDYRPAPYIEMLNQPVSNAPSLYDWQRNRRGAAPPSASR